MRFRNAAVLGGCVVGLATLGMSALNAFGADALSAKILEVNEARVKLGRGSADGIRERQVFDLYAEGKVFALPFSGGEKLRVNQVLVGRAVVVIVDKTFAYARTFETFADKGAVDIKGYAVLNASAQPPELKPQVKLREPPRPAAWRQVVPLRLDARVEAGRRAFFEWHADGGGTFLRGVEVSPGVFRTALPENDWVAPYAKKNAKALVRTLDTGGEGPVWNPIPLESTGSGGARPYTLKAQRTFSAKALYTNVRDVAFDSANRMYVIDKPGSFSDAYVRGLDDKGNDLGSAKISDHDFTALAVTDDWFYFLDLGDKTVKRYSANVELSKVFSQQVTVMGEKGDGNGKLSNPVDLAIAPDGAVLVLDAAQKCIQRFDRDGRFAYSFGMGGEGDHQLYKPVAMAVGLDGTVYVLDDGRKKIVAYRDGRVSGTDVEAGVPGEDLRGLALDPWDNSLHVLDAKSGQLKHFSAAGGILGKNQGATADDAAWLSKPVRVRVDQARVLHVLDREGGAIARFDSEKRTFVSRSGGVELSKEIRVAASADGDLAALDKDSRYVVRFDTRGWITARFGGEGNEPGQLKTPEGIAIDAAGQVFVVDAKKIELLKYMASGVHLKSSSGGGQTFSEIRDLQMSSHREMLSVLQDRDDQRALWLVSPEEMGEPPFKLPQRDPSEPFKNVRRGTIVGPLSPAAGGSDPICWIVDKKGERVSTFSWKSNDPVKLEREFDKVTGITASCADLVFICDYGNKQIDVYDGTSPGRYLTTLKDEDACKKPLDVATDDLGRLFVFDEDKKQFVVFGE